MARQACVAAMAAAILTVGLGAPQAEGAWSIIETFEGLPLGEIDGQHGWHDPGLQTEVVTIDGEGDNQSMRLVVDTGVLYKAAAIPDGQARMLFLRFRFVGQHNYSLGMSHLTNPTEFSDFGPELRKSAAQDNFKIHDGTNYVDLATLAESTWYNLWVYIDNGPGRSQVWLHGRGVEGAAAGDQLSAESQTVFDFRTDANADLVNFYLKAAEGGSGQDPLWIDDIYLEETGAMNLSNPVPEPAAWGLIALGLLGLIRRR